MSNQAICIIPARSGSKGLVDKNIRLLSGKPLLAWSIEAAMNSKCFEKIVVSTDSEHYAEIARTFGAEVPFIRPADLATDSASSIDVCINMLEYYQNQGINNGESNLHVRRQDLNSNYYFYDGSIYLSYTYDLLKMKSFYHEKTLCKIFSKFQNFEIDDEDDFKIIEAIVNKFLSEN